MALRYMKISSLIALMLVAVFLSSPHVLKVCGCNEILIAHVMVVTIEALFLSLPLVAVTFTSWFVKP
jgi:hypothetical protein